jgi:glucosamine--fructose-6-phosphate aminotransferase (isomerizing)
VLARQRQAYAIGITGDPQGPLAKAADAVLIQTVPDLAEYGQYLAPGTLGLGNFHASLLALYLSAFRIAELRGRIDAAKSAALKKHLLDSAAVIAQTAQRNERTALELAKAVYHLDTFFIIGGGPNYATTLFAAAKIFEQPHASASPQELEEWAHEQYFLTRPNVTPLFVIAPPGNSRDRAIEQIHGARDMGATVIAVCDSEDSEIKDLAHWSMPVYGQLPEEFTPLAYVVPSELFATALHRIKGRPPLIAPFDRERMREVNFRQISGSAIKGS